MKKIIVKDCIECPLVTKCEQFKKLKPKTRFAMATSIVYSGILKNCPLPDDKEEVR